MLAMLAMLAMFAMLAKLAKLAASFTCTTHMYDDRLEIQTIGLDNCICLSDSSSRVPGGVRSYFVRRSPTPGQKDVVGAPRGKISRLPVPQ